MTQTSDSRPVALVTGARRGIGRGICLALARKGFDLVVNDLVHDDDMDTTVAQLEAAGARARVILADVSERASRQRLAREAWQAFDGLECLVNNAGISVKVRGDLLDVTEDSFDRLIAVDLKAMFFLTQDIARRMVDGPAGRGPRSIVNISSINTIMASPERAEYCLAKVGVSMATRLYALRLADAGIRVYEIRPGVIDTAMTRVVHQQYVERIEAGLSPIRRFGTPDDVGQAVATLAEGTAFPFSTGDAFCVDGGLHIARL